jgi:hypothetical protein
MVVKYTLNRSGICIWEEAKKKVLHVHSIRNINLCTRSCNARIQGGRGGIVIVSKAAVVNISNGGALDVVVEAHRDIGASWGVGAIAGGWERCHGPASAFEAPENE